jgi:hypothetical protein
MLTAEQMDSLDEGICGIVKILDAAGVETFESCQGGPGHSMPEPTVRFHGTIAAGWRALGVCFDNGLSVLSIGQYWDVNENQPSGPYWQIVFRKRAGEDGK